MGERREGWGVGRGGVNTVLSMLRDYKPWFRLFAPGLFVGLVVLFATERFP